MTISEIEPETLDLANHKLIDSINTLKANLGTCATNAKILSIVHSTPCPTLLEKLVRELGDEITSGYNVRPSSISSLPAFLSLYKHSNTE